MELGMHKISNCRNEPRGGDGCQMIEGDRTDEGVRKVESAITWQTSRNLGTSRAIALLSSGHLQSPD